MENYKLLPRAIELEKFVLGAILINQNCLPDIAEILEPNDFYSEKNKIIFQTILEIDGKIDYIILKEQLKKNNQLKKIGGVSGIIKLTDNIVTTDNVIHHAKIVKEKSISRNIIKLAYQASEKAYNGEDCFDIINELQTKLISLTNFQTSNISHISEIVNDIFQIINLNNSGERKLNGIPTGFSYFDKKSSGLQKGDLIVVAGETSNGKTSLMLDIIFNAAMLGYKCGIFSLEMTKNQLTARLMAKTSQIGAKRILMDKLSLEEIDIITATSKKLVESNIYIDRCSNKFSTLANEIKSAKMKLNLDLIVIDYLQLITNFQKRRSTADEVAEIVNTLKVIAVNLNIPIILVSQLKRATDGKYKPTLARLKNSGDIENAADIVLLICRPEEYGDEQIDFNGQMIDTKGLAVIDIAKGRNIGTGKFLLNFNKELTTFTNYQLEL